MPPRLRLSIRGWIGRIDYWARVMGCFKEQPRLFSLKMISQRLETQNSSTAYQLKQLTVGSHDLKTMQGLQRFRTLERSRLLLSHLPMTIAHLSISPIQPLMLSAQRRGIGSHFYRLWYDPAGDRTPTFQSQSGHTNH